MKFFFAMFRLFNFKKQIVFVHISGGLGNQLFQIANILETVIEIRPKSYWLIFLYTGNPRVKKSHEYPRFKDLGISATYFDRRVSKWLIRALKALGKLKLVKIYFDEKSNKLLLKPGINFIEGLFQKRPHPTIRRFIKGKLIVQPIAEKYSVLHIRLGDYLSMESLENVGVVSDDFYIQCMYLLNKHRHKIWVVSDGTNSQIDKILSSCRIPYQIHSSTTDLEDFKFISNAEVVAISNSTFSLWACYLKQNKKVIYPSLWFPARQRNSSVNPRVYEKWLSIDVDTGGRSFDPQ